MINLGELQNSRLKKPKMLRCLLFFGLALCFAIARADLSCRDQSGFATCKAKAQKVVKCNGKCEMANGGFYPHDSTALDKCMRNCDIQQTTDNGQCYFEKCMPPFR